MMTVAPEMLQQAQDLLAAKKNDAAIELLRSRGAPNHHALCTLLARAYFQRGDSRGDIYSSHYFAKRAQELGESDPGVRAIQAISAFRKEHYAEAAEVFASFVTPRSPAATQAMYALALAHDSRPGEARQWADLAAKHAPGDPNLRAVNARLDTLAAQPDGVHRLVNGKVTIIDTLRASDATEIPSPHRHNPVSMFRGQGSAAKDFHWLDKNIPCQKACPAGTDIPEYLSAIYRGDYDRAYRINLWDNVFPAVLGRVCSRPCEDACRHGWDGLGDSVAICFSKRSASDFKTQPPVLLPPLYPATGKKIAVVGAGPGGLAAARQLALLGHQVTVYEKHNKPGGMMNQGIPEFRLPRDIIDREIAQVSALGVSIICNTEIGKTLTLRELDQRFDAIVLAAGTLRPNLLNLPGKELKGISHGLAFLLEVNETNRCADFGKQVLVIGGGFTAMDCARTAWRLKADTVRVMYRRSQKEMLITPGELEELGHEGIPMEFMVSPVAFVGDAHGQVKAMRFVRTTMGEPDDKGRRRPIDIPGSEFEVPCDTVLLATGQFPDTAWMDADLKAKLVGPDEWLLSGKTPRTAEAKIFTAGDFALGATTLIEAIAHGKQAARQVDTALMGEERLLDVAVVSDTHTTGRIREMDAVPLQIMPTIPVEERHLTAEVETGFTQPLATDETQRCYLCHYKYEIDADKCIYCDWCIKAKPRPDCIVRISEVVEDADGAITGFKRAKGTDDTKFIWINQEDCIRCNACVDVCPVDCISIQKVSKKVATPAGFILQ